MLASSSSDIKMALSPVCENVTDKVRLLKDGYKIFESDYKKLLFSLFNIAIEHEKAFMELVTKCIVPEYTISQEAQALLQLNQFMNLSNANMPKKDVMYVIYDLLDNYGFKNIQAVKYSLSSWLELKIEYLETFAKIIKRMILSVVPSVDALISSQSEMDILEDIRNSERIILKMRKSLEDATINAKIMGFLADHKYKLLFIAALISYGVYDYYHENCLEKAAISLKNNLHVMWQKATASPEKDKDNEFQLDGFPGLSF